MVTMKLYFLFLMFFLFLLSGVQSKADEFVAGPSLNNRAVAHSATLLENGAVLVVGFDAEIFDPVTKKRVVFK